MNEPMVTIVVRSFNEAWALQDTLPAIQQQNYKNWELVVVDSGSRDGSVELIKKAQPKHFLQIQPHEYNPSKVLNYGMCQAQSDYVVFLNSDATPTSDNWLRPLVNGLQNPVHAAVFGRQVPRPDCQAVYACDYDRCFGEKRESIHWDHFFSMVSSGIRKDIWSKRGFLTKLQYAEDDEYTRWCVQNGYQVVYCQDSVVMHSHNYTKEEAYKRSFGDARALAASWDKSPTYFNFFSTVLAGVPRDLIKDYRFCKNTHRKNEMLHCALIRWYQRMGKYRGFKAGWQQYRLQAS